MRPRRAGPVTSPTFVIARTHPSLVGGPGLVHVDAYRLRGGLELDDLDLDTSLEGSVTVVEWGSGVAELLSADRLEIVLCDVGPEVPTESGAGTSGKGDVHPDGGADAPRTARIRPVGSRWDAPSDRAALDALASGADADG